MEMYARATAHPWQFLGQSLAYAAASQNWQCKALVILPSS